jgi:hypothetical protein
VGQSRAAKWIKLRGTAGRRRRLITAPRSETAPRGPWFLALAQRPARVRLIFSLWNHHDLGVFLSHNQYNW